LTLPMALRIEPAPDDPNLIAFSSGPVVLAADLGSADNVTYDKPLPAFIGAPAISPTGEPHTFTARGAQPEDFTLQPYFSAYDSRTAVYLPRVTEEAWTARMAAFDAAKSRRAALDARTVDMIALGEDAPEGEHHFRDRHSERISYALSSGRQAWW